MEKIYAFFKKNGIPTIMMFISFDSYRRLLINEQMESERVKNMVASIKTNVEASEKENFDSIKLQNKEVFDSLGITTIDEWKSHTKIIFEFIKKGKENHSEIESEFIKHLESDKIEKAKLDAYRSHYKLSLEQQNLNKELEENSRLNKSDPELEVKIEDNNNKLNETKDKLIELEEISKSNIGEIFNFSFEKFVEFLDGLSADKIVCVFNIIVGGTTLSSFLSVLSILISENIINRIKFLDKYPRILKLLKLRNTINKKIIKFHLFMHFIWIVVGILCNIYMFFL